MRYSVRTCEELGDVLRHLVAVIVGVPVADRYLVYIVLLAQVPQDSVGCRNSVYQVRFKSKVSVT